MAQSKEFVDASHALNDLSHALALLESENASLRGAVDGLCNDNAKLRELLQRTWDAFHDATAREFVTVKNELRELGVEVDDGLR